MYCVLCRSCQKVSSREYTRRFGPVTVLSDVRILRFVCFAKGGLGCPLLLHTNTLTHFYSWNPVSGPTHFPSNGLYD